MTEITSEMLAQWKTEAEQASKAIERDGYADYGVDPAEVLSLIAEVERLREKNSIQAQLIERIEQDDSAVRVHAISCAESEEYWRKEGERLRAQLAAVDRALGNTPTIVWDNSPTRAESIRELGEEVARLRAERQWQPMEKCPSDKWVLIFCSNYQRARIAIHRWDGWQAKDDLVDDVEPTHWMPLPKPPEQKP